MKTLVVSYLARGEHSYTKKLLDTFLAQAKGTDIVHLDLTIDVPDNFLKENLGAYIQRNYMGQELSPKHKQSISKMDRMTQQLKSADAIVLATPMYNFSLPAIVKAWFDSVILKGETWDIGESGYSGLLKGKKALILMASGGAYEGPMSSWDHAMPLAKQLFNFMGVEEVSDVRIQGVNAQPDKVEGRVKDAQEKVKEISRKWYS